MSVLKCICALNARRKDFHPLKLTRRIQGTLDVISSSYSTEPYIPPVHLPGRKTVYEPDYLDKLKPEIPTHNLLNLKLVGYDYIVLERLQRLIHGLLDTMEIEVVDAYAMRAESWRVQRFAPNSSKSVAEFQMKEYQRVLQIDKIPSTKLSILVELMQAITPPGVTSSIKEHTEEEEKLRYIPDLEIKALQEQLEELGGPSKQAQKKASGEQFIKK